MAIVVDNQASLNQTSAADPWNLTFSMGSVTNGILIIWIMQNNVAGGPLSATFNSVAMTALPNTAPSGIFWNPFVYYLVNPPSGSHTISWSLGGSNPTTGRMGAISFAGVNQVTPIPNYQVNTGTTSSNFTSSLTTTGTNSVLLDAPMMGSGASALAVSGITSAGWTNGGGVFQGGYSAAASPGSHTNSWTFTGTSKTHDDVIMELQLPPSTSVLKASGIAQANIGTIEGVTNANANYISGIFN